VVYGAPVRRLPAQQLQLLLLQLPRGVQPQLVGQPAPEPVVRRQRQRRATRGGKRAHEQARSGLVQRLLVADRLQVLQGLDRPYAVQVRLGRGQDSGTPRRAQPQGHRSRDLGDRLLAQHLQGPGKQSFGTVGVPAAKRPAGVLDPSLSPQRVHGLLIQRQPVA